MSIRTTKTDGNRVLFAAKDVCEKFGINYRGRASFKGVKSNIAAAKFPTKVGKNTSMIVQYALDEKAVREFCKVNKKDVSVFGFDSGKGIIAAKDVAALEKTIDELKLVVAQLLTKENGAKNSLPLKGKAGSVSKADPLQAQARKQVRELVQEYAGKRANELGISGESRSIFFDLSFKALYTAYKNNTPNNLDLKALAEKETESGVKTSGLQIAEKLGLAIELLQFAKSFYNVK